MTRLNWAKLPREMETGVDRGVFYPHTGDGQAWDGLISVDESSEFTDRVIFVDGVKIQNQKAPESFAGTITAYTYPDIFDQRSRQPFGMSYRVGMGKHYKIHLVYNIKASPSSRHREYNNPDPFAWNFTTTPVDVSGRKLTAHLIVDTSQAYPAAIQAFEDLLYGDDAYGLPTLPLPDEVYDIFEANALLRVIDKGNGLYTIVGPTSAITDLGSQSHRITWPSVVQIDTHTYTIESF